jgi:hypothetical protein
MYLILERLVGPKLNSGILSKHDTRHTASMMVVNFAFFEASPS